KLVKDATKLVKDATKLVKNATKLVKDATKLVKDATKLVKDATKLVKDVTKLVKDVTKLVKDVTKRVKDVANRVKDARICWRGISEKREWNGVFLSGSGGGDREKGAAGGVSTPHRQGSKPDRWSQIRPYAKIIISDIF
ncbi:MAG: hypothetical protein V4584_16610, partial [Verrucomicrobiota bacterium]